MIKSLGLSAALLSIVLLMCTGAMSAQTARSFVPTASAIQINAVTSAFNQSQILTLWATSMYTGGRYGYEGDEREKEKKNKEKENYPHGPSPNPEPSTILSFGAALLIGGGVLYSRRLRGSKK